MILGKVLQYCNNCGYKFSRRVDLGPKNFCSIDCYREMQLKEATAICGKDVDENFLMPQEKKNG